MTREFQGQNPMDSHGIVSGAFEGRLLREEVSGDETGITYAPEGGYRANSGSSEGVTHGFQIGVRGAATATCSRTPINWSRRSRRAIHSFVGERATARDSGRPHGRQHDVDQSIDITGQPEVISLATTRLNDGRLLYLVGVAPQRDAGTTTTCSARVRQSVQLSDQ